MIPDDWKLTRLGDLVDIKHGYAFQGRYFTDTPTENVLLTPGNFAMGGGFSAEKSRYYNGHVPETYVLQENELIITMTDLSRNGDTLGYPAMVPKTAGKKYLHNQRLGKVLLKDKSKLDKKFLYYLLCTQDYRNEVLSTATGSTVRHTSPDRIKLFEFPAPTIQEQRTIGQMLGIFDQSICTNREMNKTIEDIAQALFKHWFIEFEFPDEEGEPYKSSHGEMVYDEEVEHEIPKGWTVLSLGEYCEFAYGVSLRRDLRKIGFVPVYGSNGQVGWHDKALVSGPGIVVGRKGNPGTITWVESDFFPIDTTFYVVPRKNPNSMHYLFHVLSLLNLPNLSSDTAVPGLNRNVAYRGKMLVPPDELLDIFEQLCKILTSKVHLNCKQIGLLVSLRENLLPRLMSGKIRIPRGD